MADDQRQDLIDFLRDCYVTGAPQFKYVGDLDFDGRQIIPRAVSKYKHTILARKNNQIVGARVGSIERFPWMATPLPTHMPEPVEIIKAFIEELTKKENYRKVGIKTGTKVYVAKVLATRNSMRGLVSKIK